MTISTTELKNRLSKITDELLVEIHLTEYKENSKIKIQEIKAENYLQIKMLELGYEEIE